MNIRQLEQKIGSLKKERDIASQLLSTVVNLTNFTIVAKYDYANGNVDLTGLLRDDIIRKRLEQLARQRYSEAEKEIQDFEAMFVDN
jgi:hypothetical protein